MYRRHAAIQLFISTWTTECGNLFDFNTKQQQQYISFKASKHELTIPRHLSSQYFYFIHQSTFRDERHSVIIERRKTNCSIFNFANKNSKFYRLLTAFKIYHKKVASYKYAVFIRLLDPTEITTAEVNGVVEPILTEKPFIVVRSFPDGYPLKEGQLLRFAKAQFLVQETAVNQSCFDIKEDQILYINNSKNQDLSDTKGYAMNGDKDLDFSPQSLCKICYDSFDPSVPQNPLVTPCKCSGEIQFIHVLCLKQWIEMKLKKFKDNPNEGNVYNIKELTCQICKQKLPKKIVINGKQYFLLTFLEDFTPYIAVQCTSESANSFPTNNEPVFITIPQHTVTTIGRLQQSGMILYQNSVSRNHAQLRLQKDKNQFFVTDSNSKYGTLVYEKGVEFQLHSTIRAIEIGSSVFSFKLIPATE